MPIERFIDWMNVQPVIVLLMAIAAIVLFGASLTKSPAQSAAFWPWVKRIIEASVGAVLFLGLLWAFRTILNSNMATFYSTHGSLSNLSRQSAWSIWGRPHMQTELSVTHYIEKMVQEEIPQADPTKPPLYKDKLVREELPQNSIIGFSGQVTLTLSEREKGYAFYSGYLIAARFEYTLVNASELETEADFVFPLSPNQTLHENFRIWMDEQDLSQQLHFSGDMVRWVSKMQPHQQSTIVVSYASRGMDTFTYQISNQREIKNFVLVVTVDRLPVSLLNYPDGALTPTEIRPTDNRAGSILTWKLDKAITVAGMGVALLAPEQPGAKVLQVLVNSSYALTLLIAVLCLTLLICGEKVNFLDLVLLSGVYSVYYMIMAAISDYFFGFWGALGVGAALTLGLTFLLFRKASTRLLRGLIYGLVVFFTLVYPLAGLLPEVVQRNAFESLVQVGLIVYLFGLALYTQVTRRRPAAPETTPTAG